MTWCVRRFRNLYNVRKQVLGDQAASKQKKLAGILEKDNWGRQHNLTTTFQKH